MLTMIDLHCHILPGIDDGSPDLETSLAMARLAVEDGTTTLACTPHILPGLYDNNGPDIRERVTELQGALIEADIPLQLTYGADTHIAPDLVGQIRAGWVPTLNGSRYFLLEPPHHVAPPRFEETVFKLLAVGYVPVITHPERLGWIRDHYPTLVRLVAMGAWMQITAGSLVDRFGRDARYWAERMLDEGLVHILASDGHSLRSRPPVMTEGYDAASRRLGESEARNLVLSRPQGILDDAPPDRLPELPQTAGRSQHDGWWSRMRAHFRVCASADSVPVQSDTIANVRTDCERSS